MSGSELDIEAIRERCYAGPLAEHKRRREELVAHAREDLLALIARVADLEERCLRLAEEVVNKARELDETEEECGATQTRIAELEEELAEHRRKELRACICPNGGEGLNYWDCPRHGDHVAPR